MATNNTKNIREVFADDLMGDALKMGTDVVKKGTEKLNGKTTDEADTTQATTLIDPLQKMEQQNQDARSLGLAVGLSNDEYQQYFSSLTQGGVMTQKDAGAFIGEVVSLAASSSVNPHLALNLAVAVAMRSIGFPQRALAILSTLAKYEQKMPGAGVFQCAMDAAQGRQFMQYVMQLRLLLVGQGVPMAQSTDLVQAMTSIVNPNSDMGSILNDYNKSKLRFEQQKEGISTQWGQMYALYEKERDAELTRFLHYFSQKMPGLFKSGLFKTLMKGLMTLSSIGAINKLKSSLTGFDDKNQPFAHNGGIPSPNYTLGGGTARASNNRPRRFAQTANQPTTNSYDVTPNLTQNMSQANSGQSFGQPNSAGTQNNEKNTNQIAQQGAQQEQFTEKESGLSTWLQNLEKQFTSAYNGVLSVMNVNSMAPNTQGSVGATSPMTNFAGVNIAALAGQALVIGEQYMDALNKQSELYASGFKSGMSSLGQSSGDGNANPYFKTQINKSGSDVTLQEIYWKKTNLYSNVQTLKSIQIMAPLVSFIRQQIPLISSVELDLSLEEGGGQSQSASVGQFAAMCLNISKRFPSVLQVYGNIYKTTKDENTKAWAMENYNQGMLVAKQWKAKAIIAVRKMKGDKFGDAATSGVGSVNTGRVSENENSVRRFARSSSDTSVTSIDPEKGMEDYYNDLYKHSPGAEGYGTLDVHVDQHHNDLTEDVAPEPQGQPGMEQHMKQKRRRFNLNNKD